MAGRPPGSKNIRKQSANKISNAIRTYAEVGGILDISPQQCHKLEGEALAKMVNHFATQHSVSIFDACLAISQLLDIPSAYIYRRLSKQTKMLCQHQVMEERA